MKPSYEELESQLAASIAAERVWEAAMMQACGEDGPKSVAEKFAALEARCAALAAENAALKSAHPQPFGREMMKALDAYEKHQEEVPETGMLDAFFILRDSIRADTTATDAFLAEVRAQGVETLTSKLQSLIDEGNFEGDEIGVIAGAVYTGADIAAQLRKGVQS